MQKIKYKGTEKQIRYWESLKGRQVFSRKGLKHTEETKQKMREKALGRKHTQETKNKISKLRKGLKLSKETRRRMSESAVGKPKGPMTDEHKEKLRKANLGKFKNRIGVKNPAWKGGIKKDSLGYVYVYKPEHPRAVQNYVRRSHLVVEEFIGRYLKPNEIVHHIDFNKSNDNINNLMIFKSNREHILFHQKIRQFGFTTPVLRQIEERWN